MFTRNTKQKKRAYSTPKLQDFESLDFNGNGYWSILSMIFEEISFLHLSGKHWKQLNQQKKR